MADEDPYTPAQDDAIKKAYTILTEHFERVLIVVDSSVEHNGKTTDAHECWWYGGSLTAIGMAEYAKDRILHSGRKISDPRESDDDKT